MKKILILLLLVPSLSWGEKMICRELESGGYGWSVTTLNPDYQKWMDKNKKVFKKQNKFWEKCVVKKSGKVLGDFYELSQSTQNKISHPCWSDAEDKYKPKGNRPFGYILLETGEGTDSYYGDTEGFHLSVQCKASQQGQFNK